MQSSLSSRLRPMDQARMPASHLGLSWRSASPEDRERIISIVTRTEREDNVVRRTPLEEVERLVDTPTAWMDNLVGVDVAGITQAFGAVFVDTREQQVARAELFAVTTPRWRGRGIGRALLAWQDSRARQMLVELYDDASDIPAQIVNVVDSNMGERRRLYAAAGFTPIRTLCVMRTDCNTNELLKRLDTDSFKDLSSTDSKVSVQPISRNYRNECEKLVLERLFLRGATSFQSKQWWERAYLGMENCLSFVQTCNHSNQVNGCVVVVPHTEQWLAAGNVDASIELVVAGNDDARTVKRLLGYSLAAAQKNGYINLSAEVDVTLGTGLALPFEELGFVEVGCRKVYSIDL